MSLRAVAATLVGGACAMIMNIHVTAQQGRGAGAAPPAQTPATGAPAAGQGRGQGGGRGTTVQNRPMHVYIRVGLKSHGPGQHDYPQFAADWSKILTDRGAIVDGSFHFPTPAELVNTDVIVMYKGDAGYMTPDERTTLASYLQRGGGLVSFHDTLCGDDPDFYSTIVGGAKKHGQVNYTLDADIPYTVADPNHPIMQGVTDFQIQDEAFYLMTWAKPPYGEIHPLMNAKIAATPSAVQAGHAGEIVPQMWTYERPYFASIAGQTPFRAFVWMQGHNYSNLAHEKVQPILLRGIAWAAHYPVDALANVAAAGGGRGRGGQ